MRDVMVVGLVGAGTLGMRALFLVGGIGLPEQWQRLLGHARPAILAALIGGFLAAGSTGIGLREVSVVATAWVVARTGRGMVAALAAGMAVALLL